MELTVSLLLDLVILGLLLYCLIQGLRRGFILTLCSLLAVLLAFLGGWYLATHAAQPLEEKLEPVILHAMLAQEESEAADSPEQTDLPSQSEQANPSENGLFHRFPPIPPGSADPDNGGLEAGDSCRAGCRGSWAFGQVAAVFGRFLRRSDPLAHSLPHFESGGQIAWASPAQQTAGGLLGLIKGLLLLMVARWILCDLLGWIPASIAAESRLLPLLSSFSIFSLLGG